MFQLFYGPIVMTSRGLSFPGFSGICVFRKRRACLYCTRHIHPSTSTRSIWGLNMDNELKTKHATTPFLHRCFASNPFLYTDTTARFVRRARNELNPTTSNDFSTPFTGRTTKRTRRTTQTQQKLRPIPPSKKKSLFYTQPCIAKIRVR